MIYKEIINNELFVYMNGQLLYKRWINEKYGMVIQANAWGNFTTKDVEVFRL